jgi:glycosyltransferase involved in cell wall biosynthesis
MRILAICVRVPAPDRKGDQVLSFYRILHLARRHEIEVVCFGYGPDDDAAKHSLESLGVAVRMIQWFWFPATLSVLKALIDKTIPFQCALFQAREFRAALDLAIDEFMPHAVYGVTIRPLRNLDTYRGALFVDLIDSMALNFSRRIKMASGLRRMLLRVEYVRVARFEKEIARRASQSFVVSTIDQRKIDEPRVHAIPLGIDTSRFARALNSDFVANVIFTGNMGYAPNVEAILWFSTHCWERIKEAVPGVQLIIAGNNPGKDISALASDQSITVTGRVASVAEVLNRSKVAIAPMQSGSGMQFKILEAMACGVPVVASSLGLGDISAVPGIDILIVDSSEAFAEAVISILKSDSLREKIGNAGWRYVAKNHDWGTLNEHFEEICGLEP